MFRAVFLPIIRSFSGVQRHWYSLCSSVTEGNQDQDGSGVVRPEPSSTRSPSCTNCTSAVVRLRNSWWWAERLPETCRVIITNKNWNSVHVGFVYKESVTMHCHTILKSEGRKNKSRTDVSPFITASREFGQLSVSAIQNTDTTVVRSTLTLTSQPTITHTFLSSEVLYQERHQTLLWRQAVLLHIFQLLQYVTACNVRLIKRALILFALCLCLLKCLKIAVQQCPGHSSVSCRAKVLIKLRINVDLFWGPRHICPVRIFTAQ
jgi:hypothetical protein